MKQIFCIVMTVCMLYACKEHTGYTIKGKLADAEGTKLVLMTMTADSELIIDSCIVKKGTFEMKGHVAYPEYCGLYVGDNGPVGIMVENAVIDVTIDMEKIQESKVTGSIENDLFASFNSKMGEFEKDARTINDNYMSLRLSDGADVDKEKEYIARMNQIRDQRIGYMKQFAKENPNRIITAIIVDRNLSYYILPEELATYADGFDAKNSQSTWVRSIKEKADAARLLATGQPFIDITMPAPDGTEIALSDYAGKGKYVLIDFWASWCRPCRMANPHVVKMYNEYKDKGFEIVGVSFDKDKAEWIKAIEDDALAWPQMSDLMFWQSKGARLYSVSAIPHTILLDKDGKILAKDLQPDELEKKLADLLQPEI